MFFSGSSSLLWTFMSSTAQTSELACTLLLLTANKRHNMNSFKCVHKCYTISTIKVYSPWYVVSINESILSLPTLNWETLIIICIPLQEHVLSGSITICCYEDNESVNFHTSKHGAELIHLSVYKPSWLW